MLFSKKKESRFQFAQSVDPIKSGFSGLDWDEIEVPAKIQDLIERNIRTLSNNSSLQSKSLYVPQMKDDLLLERLDIKDMKEMWLTKKEMMQQTNSGDVSPNSARGNASTEPNN